ncbi:MAG: hypothetical protein IPO19_09675 [Rhodoferax sp.]|nr:hypothetical protein [Rhodoferax sp.]
MPTIIRVVRVLAVTVVVALTASLSLATPPLMDQLEYESESTSVSVRSGTWMTLPRSQRVNELRLAEVTRCSAIGGPVGRWRIRENRLWLVGLHTCGEKHSLESVYGISGDAVFADWITADLVTHRGKALCGDSYIGIVWERDVTLKIEIGVLKEVVEVSNANHPCLALRK